MPKLLFYSHSKFLLLFKLAKLGSSVELAPHREHCKFRLLSGYDSESLELSVASSMENAANSKRQLTLIGLSKQVSIYQNQLAVIYSLHLFLEICIVFIFFFTFTYICQKTGILWQFANNF